MKKILSLIPVASIALIASCLTSCDNKNGKYVGECYNDTVGVGASVVLNIKHSQGDSIVGDMEIISEYLEGGGSINGTISGQEIVFKTNSNPAIIWKGRFDGNTIRGTYEVPRSFSTLYQAQYGRWEVSK